MGGTKHFVDSPHYSYEVENWVYHVYHNPQTLRYDIGLIRVATEISNNFKPIKLVNTDLTSVGTKVILIGQGRTETPNEVSSSYSELYN